MTSLDEPSVMRGHTINLDETADDAARAATARARDHLIGLQDEQGWWKGLLATNVTMDAEDLLMREFLGISKSADTEATARWIRSQQLADGAWNTYYEGPSDLSATVEAWTALRLAGDPADAEHMRRAAAFVQSRGGVERTRVFTHIWLALFGLWSWDDLPVIPPEIVLLPTGAPLALADWGCWARQTIVPLAVVATIRPVRPLGFGIDELRSGTPVDKPRWNSWGGAFGTLDIALRAYQRRPLRRARERVLAKAEQWIVDRQEADGSWGGIQPPWVYSILALHLRGRALDDPVVAAALAGLDRFTVREQTPDGPIRWIEACQSPIWDTALAMVALSDAGVPPQHPSLDAATRWMLAEEVTVPGDWSARRPDLAPGGWAFEFDNDLYPDVDDTAEVVIALNRQPTARAAVERGIGWSVGMQTRDGGWAAFDADQTRRLPTKLPFCDFGEVVDPPSADVTAHMVEMLARCGQADSVAAQRGIRWLLDNQEPGGSWFGRWGVNHLYGTGAAVPALIEAGIAADHPAITRAVDWLVYHQQDDGGWGEDIRSYADPAWIGRGTPTASQTAWALLALLAAGTAPDAVRRGIGWLVRTQRRDGTWDEPQYTGTGFPSDFSINYHLYRLVFPLSALGRYVAALPQEVSA
jgi:squalene-hopene/tetraprenyl-beta-curcumene cyclase